MDKLAAKLSDLTSSIRDSFSKDSKQDITTVGYPVFQEVAKLTYKALKDPQSKEVYNFLLQNGYISESNKTIDLQKLTENAMRFIKEIKIKNKGGKSKKSNKSKAGDGEVSLLKCIIIGLFILIVSISFFILKKRSEEGWYAINCTNIDLLLSSPTNDVTYTDKFFNNLHIIWQMTVNPAQFEQCKKVHEKRSKYIYDIVTYLQTQTDFWTVVKNARNITLFLIAYFSHGLKGLICLAASASSILVGSNVSLCNIECNKLKGVNITEVTKAKSNNGEEEEAESS